VNIQLTVAAKVIVDLGEVFNLLNQTVLQHAGKKRFDSAMQGNHFAARRKICPAIDVRRIALGAALTHALQALANKAGGQRAAHR